MFSRTGGSNLWLYGPGGQASNHTTTSNLRHAKNVMLMLSGLWITGTQVTGSNGHLILPETKRATTWQNQQNGMCTQRRSRSAWASSWRKLGSLATHWVDSEDSDQTGWMPRLIWVFAGHTDYFVGFVMRRFKWHFIAYSLHNYLSYCNSNTVKMDIKAPLIHHNLNSMWWVRWVFDDD